MTICTRCWRKARPKFKQHILALYPDDHEQQTIIIQYPVQTNTQSLEYSLFQDPLAQPRNLSDLTYYAQMFPNRLAKIGKYCNKKMKQYINERKPRFVHLTMVAMIGLVDACHSDDVLILYDDSVCESLRLLLSHPLLEHRILAAQGLCKLMNYIDDAADFRKYEPFFSPLVNMCLYHGEKADNMSAAIGPGRRTDAAHVEEMIQRVRLSGLQGVSAMIIHFYPSQLVEHYAEIIPALISNLPQQDPQHASNKQSSSDQDGTASLDKSNAEMTTASSVHTAAYDTLALIAAKISIPELDAALFPVFVYLDSCGWTPASLCTDIMVVIANGSQADNGDLVLFELLKHALGIEGKKDPPTPTRRASLPLLMSRSTITIPTVTVSDSVALLRSRLLNIAGGLISVMRVNVVHWEGMIDLLLHHIKAAIDAQESPSMGTPAEATDYQAATLHCLSAYAHKLPAAQDVISLLFNISQSAYYATPASAYQQALLHCCLVVATHWTDLRVGLEQPFTSVATAESLIRALLTCALVSQHVQVREEVYTIILNLILPPLQDEETTDESEEPDVTGINSTPPAKQRATSLTNHTTTNSNSSTAIPNTIASMSSLLNGSHKIRRFLSLLARNKLSATDQPEAANYLQFTDKDQKWLLSILYHELTCSIASVASSAASAATGSGTGTQQPAAPPQITHLPSLTFTTAAASTPTTNVSQIEMTTPKPTTAAPTSPSPSIQMDGIVMQVEDLHQNPSSLIKSPGKGASSPQAYALALHLLLVLLYHNPSASLPLQLPFLLSLQRVASSAERGHMSISSCQECHTVIVVSLFYLSKVFALSDSHEVRQAAVDLEAYIRNILTQRQQAQEITPSLHFDPEQPQQGLSVNDTRAAAATATTEFTHLVEAESLIAIVSRLSSDHVIKRSTSSDTEDSEAADDHATITLIKDLSAAFEPFNVKFLPPSRLMNEEREHSWAPSHRMNRIPSLDREATIKGIDHSVYATAPSPPPTTTTPPHHHPHHHHGTSISSTSAASGSPTTTRGSPVPDSSATSSSEECKTTLNAGEQSYASVAQLYTINTTKNEQQFRQSMRVFVDDVIHEQEDESSGGGGGISSDHPSPTTKQTNTPSISKERLDRRASLSRRRSLPATTLSARTGSAVGVDGEKVEKTGATSDQFFAAPAVAAPPTLNPSASIRQQIESSYATSPSHAVSGSVNINGTKADDESALPTSVKNIERRSSTSASRTHSHTASSMTGDSSTQTNTADWNKENWQAAEHRLNLSMGGMSLDATHLFIVDDPELEAELTDAVVYGLVDEMDSVAAHHLPGTGENILKFQFPILNTFDSYLPAEFDA